MKYNFNNCKSLCCTPVTYNTVYQLYFNLKIMIKGKIKSINLKKNIRKKNKKAFMAQGSFFHLNHSFSLSELHENVVLSPSPQQLVCANAAPCPCSPGILQVPESVSCIWSVSVLFQRTLLLNHIPLNLPSDVVF